MRKSPSIRRGKKDSLAITSSSLLHLFSKETNKEMVFPFFKWNIISFLLCFVSLVVMAGGMKW